MKMLLRLACWLAFMSSVFISAVIVYPAACVTVVLSAIMTYFELGWLFWLLLLDLLSLLAISTTWFSFLLTHIKGRAVRFVTTSTRSAHSSTADFVHELEDILNLDTVRDSVSRLLSRATAWMKCTILTAINSILALLWFLTFYQVMLLAKSVAFVVRQWIFWCIPGWCIKAGDSSTHLLYLVCTGSFSAALCFATGNGIDSHTPLLARVLLTPHHSAGFKLSCCGPFRMAKAYRHCF
ncbi:hypothetical protein ABBQ38_007719 [Trebouxia sp. C0009 RCD-2024]